MSDPQIGALRAKLAARPRSDDYRQRRQDIDARGLAYGIAADVGVEPLSANGVRAEWTTTPNASRDGALLYLHGGGYVIGSLDSHRHLVAEAGRACAVGALALDYRLAPEHPFPAAVEDALAGYRHLLARGLAPGRIAIAGDSAGGGLVVAAMLAIREAGLRLVHIAVGRYGSRGRDDVLPRRRRSDRAARWNSRHGAALSERCRPARAIGLTDLCRPQGAAAAADPGRRLRNPARRRVAAGQSRRRRRCPGRARDLAGNDPCLASVSSRTRGGVAGDPGGRRFCPRDAWLSRRGATAGRGRACRARAAGS